MEIFSPRCFISIRRRVVTLRALSVVFVDIIMAPQARLGFDCKVINFFDKKKLLIFYHMSVIMPESRQAPVLFS